MARAMLLAAAALLVSLAAPPAPARALPGAAAQDATAPARAPRAGKPAADEQAAKDPAAGDPTAVFEQGVAAYRRGDYASADTLWQGLLAHELAPADRGRVCYDLGNAAFRAGRTLDAVGWYTVASRLCPRHGDTRDNLELARRSAGLGPADRGDLRSTVARLLSSLTPAESGWLALACLAALAAALVGEALRGGSLWRRLALAGAVLFALSLLPLGWNLLASERDPMLVVAEGGMTLTSEPRKDLAPIAHLPAGTEVERIDRLPDWVRVEERGGTRGWLPADAVFALRR